VRRFVLETEALDHADLKEIREVMWGTRFRLGSRTGLGGRKGGEKEPKRGRRNTWDLKKGIFLIREESWEESGVGAQKKLKEKGGGRAAWEK